MGQNAFLAIVLNAIINITNALELIPMKWY
jgi:hypothetical protein